MARGIRGPGDDVLDFYMIASGTETTIDVGGLPAGEGWSAHARAIGPQRIRSAWSTPDNVASTDSYNPPTAVACSATDGEMYTSWTPAHTELETQVWWDTVTPFDTATATLFETFQANTTHCTVPGLAAETLIYVYVRHVGPYGSLTATASDSDTTGAGAMTLSTPDQLYIVQGKNYGTRVGP